MNKLTGWDDTIVALATPPGIGAIGVIRLSGKGAFSIANELFPSKDLLQQPSHTIHVGFMKNTEKILDEVVISLFKEPRSYTGEDVVEISCHGSPFIHEQIIEACIKKGPAWVPAVQNGRSVNAYRKQPITFQVTAE